MRASLLLLAVLATSLWACDPYASLSASNESDRAYFLRYTTPPEPDYNPFPSVVLLPARTSGVVIPHTTGTMSGTVELLDEDCAILGSWSSKSGGVVTVKSDGSVSFAAGGNVPPGEGPTLDQSFDCVYTN